MTGISRFTSCSISFATGMCVALLATGCVVDTLEGKLHEGAGGLTETGEGLDGSTGAFDEEPPFDAATPCQAELQAMGLVFEPYTQPPESPDGYPGLLCEIDDPVMLHSPIGEVGLRYLYSESDTPVLLSCAAARSVARSAGVAHLLGADEIIHLGTYNCRPIAGTSKLSQHGLGAAIDIYGFTMSDGSEVTVLDHWEDGVASPVTDKGAMLREFADSLWEMMLWNVILTPEYNAAHDNHFHIDVTPGGSTYN